MSTTQWLIVVFNPRGEKALQGLELQAAPEDWITQRNEQEAKVASQFPADNHIKLGIQRINQAEVPAETWQAMGLQCLTCSGCTNLCPTCSCFTTYDRPTGNHSPNCGHKQPREWLPKDILAIADRHTIMANSC